VKVFHLSTHDIQGGAARAAFRLHTSLNKIGVDSNMYVSYRHSNDSKVIVHHRKNDLAGRWNFSASSLVCVESLPIPIFSTRFRAGQTESP